ncbi:condensation domain-containing protein [Streptomyces sp. NPDC088812]|uniref:condensation domain-containing protein n=1 Tax=Streptomyces sp. NPDC088812 TaxID=3365905 RepID=UPI0037FAD0CC
MTGETRCTPPDASGDRLPLAPAQETLWEFMRALAPDDPGAARLPVVDFRRIEGTVVLPAFEQALHDVKRRHHALRMVFDRLGDEPLLRTRAEPDVPFTYLDLSALPAAERQRRIDALVHGERFPAFDLLAGPLWRVRLVRVGPGDHLLMSSFFHIISDGWSCQVFVEDLMQAYGTRLGHGSPPGDLDVTFGDVIAWQRALLAEDPARDAYWRRQLLPLPTEPVFPPLATPRGRDLTAEVAHPFAFGDEVAAAVRDVAWRARSTSFLVLLAAYHVLLCRRLGRDRLVAGTTTLGRTTPPARRVIGQFTNNVYPALRVGPADSFLDVVRSLHATMTEAVAHVPSFNRLARAVCPDFDRMRPWSFIEVFDYWFQSAAPAAPDIQAPGLRVRQVSPGGEEALDGPPVADLAEAGDRLPVWARRGVPIVVVDDARRGGVLIYNRDLYDPAAVGDLAAEYQEIVAALTRAPQRALRDAFAAARA